MTSAKISQRSDFLGTQVIARDSGKRLGIVSQLWVDIDRREVVALSLRDNIISGLLSGIPQYMYLSSIRQIGDVILVDDENAIEDLNADAYSSLIHSEVITEAGEMLGKVRGFKFDTNDYKVVSLLIDSLGQPLIPDQIVSTYELAIDQIVSSGPNRLIVFEGAEEQLIQVSLGVLERLGIGQPPWERDKEEYMIPTVQTDKQLGTGTPVRSDRTIRKAQPIVEDTWNEDNWEQPEPEPMRQLEPEPVYYEEEDNWGEAARERYDKKGYAEAESYNDYEDDCEDDYEDLEKDVWAEKEPRPYQAPRVNIPEKTKTPEYEGEMDY